MTILHKLNWRYATKKFDPGQVVAEELITELLRSVNLTASSYGLQPYEMIVVKNPEIQQKLVSASFDQAQIVDCSHVIIFAAKKTLDSGYIKKYIQNIAETRSLTLDGLSDYKASMESGPGSLSSDLVTIWSQKQCYIGLGTLLIAAADLKIDTCPMEGFIPEQYDEILGLGVRDLTATLVVPVGYRSVDDELQYAPKVRKRLDEMVHLKY